ncbi:MAG: ABC transporter ATP-binding protein [Halobacteria archaeon]|nr:ABC transporter ATP-binding protein [Halobacteria archaeon]
MSQIEFTDLHKHFGHRQILTGTDLVLTSGQCSLLSGANGAGKSTLLRICAGLEKPDQGEVDIGLGRQAWKRYRRTLQAETVYLHQQPYMFDGTVMQNLAYALPRGTPQPRHKQRVSEALAWAELESIASSPAKTLSGGERQRVAIARAWLREPTVMLLDEPTTNMDQEARRRTIQLLHSLKQQGIALLVASHDPKHFYSLTNSWLELAAGRIDNLLLVSDRADNVIPLPSLQQVIQ